MRRMLVGLGVCILMPLCLAQQGNGASEPPAASREASASDSRPSGNPPSSARSSVGETFKGGSTTQESEEGCTKAADKNSRDCQDLHAQKEMARWAFWMLVVTAVGAGIGLFTLFLVWLTFKQTRTSSERQLRAYLNVFECIAQWSKEKGLLQRDIQVTVEFRNKGQTPAHKVRCWCNADSFAPNNMSFTSRTDDDAWESKGVSAPGQKGTMSFKRTFTAIANEDELIAWESGKRSLFLYGKIIYIDAFDVEQTTTFRYVMPPHGIDGETDKHQNLVRGWFVATDEGNTAT